MGSCSSFAPWTPLWDSNWLLQVWPGSGAPAERLHPGGRHRPRPRQRAAGPRRRPPQLVARAPPGERRPGEGEPGDRPRVRGSAAEAAGAAGSRRRALRGGARRRREPPRRRARSSPGPPTSRCSPRRSAVPCRWPSWRRWRPPAPGPSGRGCSRGSCSAPAPRHALSCVSCRASTGATSPRSRRHPAFRPRSGRAPSRSCGTASATCASGTASPSPASRHPRSCPLSSRTPSGRWRSRPSSTRACARRTSSPRCAGRT